MKIFTKFAAMRILISVLLVGASVTSYYIGHEKGMRQGYSVGSLQGYIECWDIHWNTYHGKNEGGIKFGEFLSKEKQGIDIQKQRFNYSDMNDKYIDLSIISFDPWHPMR